MRIRADGSRHSSFSSQPEVRVLDRSSFRLSRIGCKRGEPIGLLSRQESNARKLTSFIWSADTHIRVCDSLSVSPRSRLHEKLVDITPRPILIGLEASHQWMTARMKVLRRVFADRVIATADVATGETKTKMHPIHSHLEALLATLR